MQKQNESEAVMAWSAGKKQQQLSLKYVCLSCHMHALKHRQTPLKDWMCVITSNVSAVRKKKKKAIGYLWPKVGLQNNPAVKRVQIRTDKLHLNTACSWDAAVTSSERELFYF